MSNSISKFYSSVAALGMVLALPTFAKAFDGQDFSEEARKKVPWSYAFGAYFPFATSGAKTGTDFWSSYRTPSGTFDFRSTFHSRTFDAGGASYEISTNGYDVLYRVNALYFGPGISFVSQSANNLFFPFSKPWDTVFVFTVGYDVTTRIFVETEWNALGVEPNRGLSVSAGYRF